MTTRPGAAVLEDLRYTRDKELCHLIKITRRDGFELRITDHDCTLTLEGEQYQPIIMGGLSAERREAAFRSGNQEARGIVDGTVVTIPDLRGSLYRGAVVRQIVTSWRRPWRIIARHWKQIRNVNWNGSQWVATLEGRSQRLQRNVGGRFDGVFDVKCPYVLGDPDTCRANIAPWFTPGCRVATVVRDNYEATFVAATFLASYDDDWFRDGGIEWRWSAPIVTGTATSAVTTTTLVDTSKSWTVNEHVGREARILQGAGQHVRAVGLVANYAEILSNTSDTLTVAGFPFTALSGSDYDICDLNDNAGHISPIVDYVDSSRSMTMLLPTPFPIQVGDSGILNVGCDGLLSTCKAKFSNQLNFGGDPFAPSATQIIERLDGS